MDSRDLQGLMEAYIEVCGSVSVEEGRALGKAGRDDDNNPRGAAVRASSGRGMTMTPARGLGASKPKGDDKKRAAKQAAQAKEDRRAAAKDRAAEGEDRLSKLVRSVQNSSYEPEGEQINEISANLALTASQKADEMRRKAAVAGDKETASKKAAQASRLYAGVGSRRAKERKKERVDEAMTAVASPAPGGRRKKNSYTKEIRTSAGSKTSPRYSNVSDAKERMKTPLSKYDTPKMQLKKEEYVDEAQYTAPPQIQQPPAEVRKAPKNKLDPGATVGTGIAAAYVGNIIGKKLLKKKPGVRGVFEEFDTFNYLLEYLIAEGYAATNKEALVIMANMSEEWKESIIESQYARENPEKYEREQAKAKSKKQKAMEDPHTGINSPAFEKFMRQQMGR